MTRQAWLGYYYSSGRYGDYRPAQNCTVLTLGNFADGSGLLPPNADQRMRDAAEAAGAIFIGSSLLDMDVMAPLWHLVAGIVLGEHPDTAGIDDEAGLARQHMASRGLPPRPIIATVGPDQAMQPAWGLRRPAVDVLAVEIYFTEPAADYSAMTALVVGRVANVQAAAFGLPVILIVQAYDRNFAPAWRTPRGRQALLAIQEGAMWMLGGQVVGAFWFAYARPGGVLDYPELEAIHQALATVVERPHDLGIQPVKVRITAYDPKAGAVPLTVRAQAEVTSGKAATFTWRQRRLGSSVWQVAAVNPASDPDHHYRFTDPGFYEISLKADGPTGSDETAIQRIVTAGPAAPPEPEKEKPMINDLPTYDQFLKEEGPAIDAAVFSSFRRPITAVEVRHHGWRRLRENWTQDNILRAIHNQPTVDLEQITPDFPGTPSYDDLLKVEGPEVDAVFRAARHVRPGPGDVRHNCWRRLVEGWTQDNLLKDIKGEPNDGPTLTKPGIPVGRPGRSLLTRGGLVRGNGSCFQDDQGDFNAIGASLFWAQWAFEHDREKLEKNLSVLVGRVHYIRNFAVVGPGGGWEDRTVDPHAPNWAANLAGQIDLVYDQYGIRTKVTIFASVDLCPDPADRERIVKQVADVVRGRAHAVFLIEVSNEGKIDPREIAHLVNVLRDSQPCLVAPTCAAEDTAVNAALYRDSRANVVTIHPDRSQNGTGGIWRPMRQPWEAHFLDVPQRLYELGEPIGPKSSVAMDADPLRLAMLAATGWVTGCGGFCYHTGAGIRGGGAADRASGKFYLPRPADLWDVENIEATLDALVTVSLGLPSDVANWNKQNANDRFRDYPFDYTLFREEEILRCYVTIGGDRFAGVALQVRGNVPLKAKRPLGVDIYDPLAMGQPVKSADLKAGDTVTLDGDPGNPKGYVLVGHFR